MREVPQTGYKVEMDKRGRYLNDHLAGSVVALEIADRRAKAQGDDEIGTYLRTFVDEVTQDQRALRDIMASVGTSPSLVKEGAATAASWFDTVRGALDLPGAPNLLRDIELLIIGVTGKALLWSCLERLGISTDPPLPELQRRASEQLARLEQLHGQAVEGELGT